MYFILQYRVAEILYITFGGTHTCGLRCLDINSAQEPFFATSLR